MPEAAVFYNEVTVEQSTPGTFFRVCGFGNGYFGLQELDDGRKGALFLIGEPASQKDPDKTTEERNAEDSSGPIAREGRPVGEGKGGQSFYEFDWNLGETVRFAVFANSDSSDRTQYAGYVYLPNGYRWRPFGDVFDVVKRTSVGRLLFVH